MKLIKSIIFASVFFTAFSCKKVIEVTETDLIAGATALKTVTNNEQAIIGAYGGFATEMDILLNSASVIGVFITVPPPYCMSDTNLARSFLLLVLLNSS